MMKWKRIVAGCLAAALMLNELPVYAADYVSAAETLTAPKTSGNIEEETPSEGTGENPIETPADGTGETTEETASEEIGKTPEETPSDETGDSVTETQTEENNTVSSETDQDGIETQEVTVDYAAQLAAISEAWTTSNISVQTSEQFRKLSNVNAEAYQNASISLSLNGEVLNLVDTTGVTFMGLGSEEFPFKGKLITTAVDTSITLNRAMFNVLSSSAEQVDYSSNKILITWNGEADSAVWAENYVKDEADSPGVTNTWALKLQNNYNASESAYYDFGSVIGTVAEGCSLNLKINFAAGNGTFAADVSRTGPAGLFCGELGKNTSLDISGSSLPSTFSVTSTEGNAGGIAGTMGTGSALVSTEAISLGGAGTKITAGTSGNAGGLIGEAENAKLNFPNGVTVNNASIEGGANLGGLIGTYRYTDGTGDTFHEITDNYNVQDVTFHPLSASEEPSSATAGGLFGNLYNTSAFTITYDGNSTKVNTTLDANGANYGGLIGNYGAEGLTDSLTITGESTLTTTAAPENTVVTSKASGRTFASSDTIVPGSYGGLIGNVSENSYLSIHNISESTAAPTSTVAFGGLLGNVGDSCTIQTKNISVNGSYANTSTASGGVVGKIGKGSSLRFDGITRLESGTIAPATGSIAYGQLVGTQDCSLIYALPGWADNFVRNKNQYADDIGSYGQVIRLDATNLKVEQTSDNVSADTFLVEDNAAHTVALYSKAGIYDSDITLNSSLDFARFSLTVQSRGYFSADSNIPQNPNSASSLLTKNIILGENIDMSGSGVQSLTRESGDGKTLSLDTFKGNFNGNSKILTIPMGEQFGVVIDGDTGSRGAVVSHTSNGLFASVYGTTIQNLTLNGSMKICAKGSVVLGGIAGYGVDTTSKVLTVSTVTLDTYKIENLANGNGSVKTGGILGRFQSGGKGLAINNCNVNVTIQNSGSTDFCSAGLIGYVQGAGTGNVTLSNNTVTGSITDSKATTPWSGAAIGYLEGNNNTTVNIQSLLVGDATTANSFQMNLTNGSGGLLGYKWDKADVTFQDVNVNHASLSVKNNFGGLLYEASGRITISKNATTTQSETGVQILNSSFEGTATSNTDAMLVCMGTALYLSVDEDAYVLGDNNEGNGISITKNNTNFDELVGKSKNTEYANGIVSYNLTNSTDGKIDKDSICTTYQNKTKKDGTTVWTNGNTRYYYNLPTIITTDVKDISDGVVNTVPKLMVWSMLHYADADIRKYFGIAITSGTYTISGELDLRGYSYYPVSCNDTNIGDAGNTTITFDNKAIEEVESSTPNKSTAATNSQHYGMHCGLFNNMTVTAGTVSTTTTRTISHLTMIGNVGKLQNGSGALICGKINGAKNDKAENVAATIELRFIQDSDNPSTLKGLYINASNLGGYAPLLINEVGDYSNIAITSLRTQDDAVSDGTYASITAAASGYAATSLIGKVGSEAGRYITLSFQDVRLDARETAGNVIESYGTTRTIFSRATLLEYFQYTAGTGSGGIYNFEKSEDWDGETPIHRVTYGKEITLSKRNENSQKNYYNSEDPTTSDGINTNFANGFRPYIAISRVTDDSLNEDSTYRELDVNLQMLTLEEGCGTYGDPYIIREAVQLENLAKFLNTGLGGNKWSVNIANDTTTYHVSTDETAHKLYTCNGTDWSASATDTKNATDVRYYLNDAYYKIIGDNNGNIVLNKSFEGFGVLQNEFRGVFVGENEDTTITVQAKSTAYTQMGFIRYSYGSVVKDMTIKYAGIFQIDTSNATTNAGYAAFGGVFGVIMGGDNIVDNVDVVLDSSSKILLSGTNTRLAMVGGYAGAVLAGGIIFRNMGDATKLSTVTIDETMAVISTVAEAKDDINNVLFESSSDYYYANPYVGRSLDGYAIYENADSLQTLDNTNKNYKIHTISYSENKDLAVVRLDSTTSTHFVGNITVNNTEGLYILSMIANCGASAYRSSASTLLNSANKQGDITKLTKNVYTSDAYLYGKVRNAKYNHIGDSASPTDFAESVNDEKYGKTASVLSTTRELYTINDKVSYLVKNYTAQNKDCYYASCITGAYTRMKISFDNNLKIDLSDYGNGYRGIGARYTTPAMQWTEGSASSVNSDRAYIFATDIDGANSSIIVSSKVREYDNEPSNFKAQAVGGVFNRLQQAGNGPDGLTGNNTERVIKALTIQGNVELNYYSTGSGTIVTPASDSTIGVGGLAGSLGLYATKPIKVTLQNVNIENLTVSGSNRAGGMVGYANPADNMGFEFNHCSAANVSVSAGLSAGGLFGNSATKLTGTDVVIAGVTVTTAASTVSDSEAGGLAGKTTAEVNISNITETSFTENGETKDNSIQAIENTNNRTNIAGGVVGYGTKVVTIKDSSVQKTTIKGKTIGGIIGKNDGILTVQNSTIIESTLNGINNAGALVGYLNSNLVGSNLLWKNNITSANSYGVWIGNNNSKKTIQLAGVSRQADNTYVIPTKDVGNQSTENTAYKDYSSYIAYADYTGNNEGIHGLTAENEVEDISDIINANKTYNMYVGETLYLNAMEGYTLSTNNASIVSISSGTFANVIATEVVSEPVTVTATSTSGGDSYTCTINIEPVGRWVEIKKHGDADLTLGNISDEQAYLQNSSVKYMTTSDKKNMALTFPAKKGEKYQIISYGSTRFRVGLYASLSNNAEPIRKFIYKSSNDANNTTYFESYPILAELPNKNPDESKNQHNSALEYSDKSSQPSVEILDTDGDSVYVVIGYYSEATGYNLEQAKKNIEIKKWDGNMQADVSQIAITSLPTKTSYSIGESLDTNGLTVQGRSADGGWRILNSSEYTVSDINSTVIGVQRLSVTLNTNTEVSTSYQVAVSGSENTSGGILYTNVTTSPISNVLVVDEAGVGTAITGDAACFTKNADGNDAATSIAQKILNDYDSKTKYPLYYPGAADYNTNYKSQTEMLTTYKTIQDLNEASRKDFPVLVLTTNQETVATAQIEAYLNLLTNGGYGNAKSKNTTSSILVSSTAQTYRYVDGKYVKQTNASVQVRNANTSSMTYRVYPGRYDNTLDQFTLLSVTFGDATTGQFTLYVPIVVKQVVQISSSAVVHNDSPFYASTYDERVKSRNHILLGYGDTFTTQIDYSYSNYDWTAAANGGTNLKWNYDKTITFDPTPMPAMTQLTLIDTNNSNKSYTYTVPSGGISSINLSSFSGFETVGMDQLLDFQATVGSGNLVECSADLAGETIQASYSGNIIHLRPETADDVDTTRYSVTAAKSATERYYLVITMPENGTDVISSAIKLSVDGGKANAEHLPYDFSQENGNEKSYVINANITQKLEINDGKTLEEVQKGRDVIFNLIDEVSLQKTFASYVQKNTDEVWQQFDISLQKLYDKNTQEIPIPSGTHYSVGLTLWQGDTQYKWDGTVGKEVQTVVGNITSPQSSLTVNAPNNLANLIAELYSKSAQTEQTVDFQIKAEVSFNFMTDNAMEIFPSYGTSESFTSADDLTSGYIRFEAASRMNYSKNTLSSGTKISAIGTSAYYQVKQSEPGLIYNYDDLSQLGINLLDLRTEDSYSIINSTGVYDISTVDNVDEVYASATGLNCKLIFEQKGADDQYHKVDASTYLDGIYAGKGNTVTKISGPVSTVDSTYTWSILKKSMGDYYDVATNIFTLPFEIRVKNDIESDSGIYANFKVTLEVTLEGEGLNQDIYKRSDFIIYTFAKVPTSIVE